MFHLLSLLPFLASAQAYFVLQQNVLETTRLDPIKFPGTVADHVHTVTGGNNFAQTLTYANTQEGTCTTGPVTADKSSYWIPQLYYYNPSTTGYQAVQVSQMNTYYIPRKGTSDTVKAFPDGLRMTAGDALRKAYSSNVINQQAISYACLGANVADSPNFPTQQCPQGLKAQLSFPTCWDGVNLTSDNMSHMNWPLNSNSQGGGNCPSSHPVKVVQLYMEFIFNTGAFPYNSGADPTWVWSNGDTTGYGLHGGFVSGWPALADGTNVLQKAIEQCSDANAAGSNLAGCAPLAAVLDYEKAKGCLPRNNFVNEDVGLYSGEIASLPGNNVAWSSGTKPTKSNYVEPTTTYWNGKSTTPDAWAYSGCIAEGLSGRALLGSQAQGLVQTTASCMELCADNNFPMAAMEYGGECYCGSRLRNQATNATYLDPVKCNSKCTGNNYELCGGSNTLSLWTNPDLFPTSINAQEGYYNVGGGWANWPRNCITEPEGGRLLTGYSVSRNDMTPAVCRSICATRSYKYAGVEYGSECYCGNQLEAGGYVSVANDNSCDMPCVGLSSQLCGGNRKLNIFYHAADFAAAVLPTNWVSEGCYNGIASGSARALTGYYTDSDVMTPTLCINECAKRNFMYAATEYGRECRCGDSINSGSTQQDSAQCNMPCGGSSSALCGGSFRSSMYKFTGTYSTVGTIDKPQNGGVSISGWTAQGCYTEATSGRALSGYTLFADDMTIPKCVSTCQARGFQFAGVEFANQCFCGSALAAGSVTATDHCDMACVGDKTTLCGGSNRLHVYKSNTPPSTTAPTATSADTSSAGPLGTGPGSNSGVTVTGFTNRGCWLDVTGRSLTGGSLAGEKMTAQACTAYAKEKGFKYAGTEWNQECWVGNTLKTGTNQVYDVECDRPCTGDSSQWCGGNNRMNLWENNNPGTAGTITVPAGSASVGCYKDFGSRQLQGSQSSDDLMTNQLCISRCASQGYALAGTEYNRECYCGNSVFQRDLLDSAQCDSQCFGDNSQFCGGSWKLSVSTTGVGSPVYKNDARKRELGIGHLKFF